MRFYYLRLAGLQSERVVVAVAVVIIINIIVVVVVGEERLLKYENN